jgi:assimilatory nitrate reductase catalytic subunit
MSLVRVGETIKTQSRNFPTNRGGLCQKGWTSTELLTHSERLTSPLVRDIKGGVLRNASWEEAFDCIATNICRLQTQYGRNAVGVFGGGGLTNEKAYALGKFARVALRSSHIDYNGRFCMSSAAAASIKAFGVDRGLPFPLADIPHAQTIVLCGSNPVETMPVLMQYFEAQRRNGGQLIVIDPRHTPTAAAANLHLQITPGTDIALANGLLYIAIKEGWIDEEFIAERTTGFEQVRRAVSCYWPDRVERITGIPENHLYSAARMLNVPNVMTLTGRGPEQHSKGVDTVLGFINLTLALGKAGKPYSGYGCLTGQGNGQGGREHGQKADQLPGYRKIDNPEHRSYIASVWGIPAGTIPGPGPSAYEMLDKLGADDGVRGLLVFGSNLTISVPRANRIQERLQSLDFLCVADIFLSETAQFADVVLPSTQWAEEEGTMTNLEGRVLLRRPAADPPNGVRSDLEAICEIAVRMGAGEHFSSNPHEVFDELRRASSGGTADYCGITYERIECEDGIFWPCPSENHPGTPRLFLDRFAMPDGRARFHVADYRSAAEEPDSQYPLYLTTGRILQQYQSGTQTRRIKQLLEAAPEAFVEIHPSMASFYGVANGDLVRVTTRRGSAVVKAKLTPSIRMDTAFMPFHFAGHGRANLLTNPALDPVSRMPEFKVCAARIEKEIGC